MKGRKTKKDDVIVKQQAWDLTPEQEVIVGAVRVDRTLDNRIQELIRQGLDWLALRRTALKHGVLPIVSRRLEELGQDLVPEEEGTRLKHLRRANARRSLIMTAELLKILKLLDSQTIPSIFFKGPLLAVQAYGDSSLRQFADLDILVHQKDLHETRKLLVEHGYASSDGFTPAQERSHLKRANELAFAKGTRMVYLDLHWRLAADYLIGKLDSDAAFVRRTFISIDGRQVPTLAADDMLLYLCMNGLKYTWTKLSILCDIARTIEAHPGLDWQGLFRRAETAGLRRTFLLGVTLARDVLGTNIPALIAEAAYKDRVLSVLRERARRRLFTRGDEEPGFLETAPFQLQVKDSLRDRISYCFIRAFFPTAEDWKLLSLPDSLFFFYYFIRPLRLAGLRPRRSRTSPSAKEYST